MKDPDQNWAAKSRREFLLELIRSAGGSLGEGGGASALGWCPRTRSRAFKNKVSVLDFVVSSPELACVQNGRNRVECGTRIDALLWPREEANMTTNTVAQMTQSEFKEMLEAVIEAVVEQKLLEILGDPDEGLEIRQAVQDRLVRQKQAVAEGENGQPFEDVVRRLGLD
jgi:hypothetical protein